MKAAAGMGAYFVSALVAWLALHLAVAVHEWAHLEIARMFGVPAPRVVVGVGPALFRVRRRGTTWHIFLIPLLGYVLMLPWRRLPPAIRIYVALAGPFANVLVALLLLEFLPASRNYHSYCCGLIAQVMTMHEALRHGVIAALHLFAYMNVGMGVFNLIPISPLDGSAVLEECVRVLRRLTPWYRPSPLWWRVWSMGGLAVTITVSVGFLLSDVMLLWTPKHAALSYDLEPRPRVRKKRVGKAPKVAKPAGRERNPAAGKKAGP